MEFINNNPIISLLAFWSLMKTLRFVWNRAMRHLNIRRHGWPPAHLDADGDFKPEPQQS